MTIGLHFDDQAARRIEAIYMSPNVLARRRGALDALEPRPGERALDIGSGPGFMTSELAAAVGPSGSVSAVDNSESMLATAQARIAGLPVAPRVQLTFGDATRLPFSDREFDMAVALQVYEYVGDVRQVCSRVLEAAVSSRIVSSGTP